MINAYLSKLDHSPNPEPRCYRVSGKNLTTDTPIEFLQAFEKDTLATQPERPALPEADVARNLVYDGPGWIGQEWRNVQCSSGPFDYRIAVSAVGEFSVSQDGRTIVLLKSDEGVHRAVLEEALLGPALVLGLALRDTWCLHGSAALFNGEVVLFVGDSGFGKSTLARYLASAMPGDWQRVADDLLPLRVSSGRLEARPHFPQLKLGNDQQPGLTQPECLPVAAVFNLSGPDSDIILCRPLVARARGLVFARHTVASRLFDNALLARHLEFCATASSLVKVMQLSYPHHLEVLPGVAELISSQLSS